MIICIIGNVNVLFLADGGGGGGVPMTLLCMEEEVEEELVLSTLSRVEPTESCVSGDYIILLEIHVVYVLDFARWWRRRCVNDYTVYGGGGVFGFLSDQSLMTTSEYTYYWKC